LAAEDEATSRKHIAVTRMIAASPALLAREQQILARYTGSLARLIAEETGSESGDVRPYAVANALIGVHRALIALVRERIEDAATDRDRLRRELRRRGAVAFELLSVGLDDYAPKG